MSLQRISSRSFSFLKAHPLETAGALMIIGAVLVVYQPSLANGFFSDEYIRLDKAARLTGLDYWALYFDPRLQDLWYRPMVGIQWKLEYLLFGPEFSWYRLVQMLYHALNSVLAYAVVIRLTRQWRAAFIAGLVYAVLPLTSMAVYWAAVHDPLAGVFAFLALLAWLDYLESGSRLKLGLTYGLFIGALMSKEVTLCLPIFFFLAERLFYRKSWSLSKITKQYVGFVLIMLLDAGIWYVVTTRSVFTQQIGVRVGEHALGVFLYYLAQMALPWPADDVIRYDWLGLVILWMAYAVLRGEYKWLFVAAAGMVPVLAVSPIPPHLTNTRYVYLPMIGWAVILALIFESLARKLRLRRWRAGQAILGLVVVTVVVVMSGVTGEQIVNYGGSTRQIRLQFRPIYQQYPTVQQDTLFYFLDTPMQSEDISGLLYLRYGSNAIVSGTDRTQVVKLRDHRAAAVCYLADQEAFQCQTAGDSALSERGVVLPMQFGDSILLKDIDVAGTSLRRGEPLILLGYWQALGTIPRDYTIFAHLVNGAGETVASFDTQPHNGNAVTSGWRNGRIMPDGLSIPIGDDVPDGEYRLELGWYFAPTGERLPAFNSDGQPTGDKLDIGPFRVN